MVSESACVVLVGGNANGRAVTVRRVAGHWPGFLGVRGSSYLRVGASNADIPQYRWEPVTPPDRAAEQRRRTAEQIREQTEDDESERREPVRRPVTRGHPRHHAAG